MSQKTSAVKRAQQSEVRPHQPGQEAFKTILSEDVDWKPFPAFPPSGRLAVVDKLVVDAAQAYGDPKKDNHVAVAFVSGDQGGTDFTYNANGKTVTYQITVNIPGSHADIALDEDVGHEGSHVGTTLSIPEIARHRSTRPLTGFLLIKRQIHTGESLPKTPGHQV